jgi:hypothetical protein
LEIIGFPIFRGLDAVKSLHAGVATIGLVGAGASKSVVLGIIIEASVVLSYALCTTYFLNGACEQKSFKGCQKTGYSCNYFVFLLFPPGVFEIVPESVYNFFHILCLTLSVYVYLNITAFFFKFWREKLSSTIFLVDPSFFNKLVVICFILHRLLSVRFIVEYIIQ